MKDRFSIISLRELLQYTLSQIERGGFAGIPQRAFFNPAKEDPFRTERYGRQLDAPVGVAAGPHTQMAQNIMAAYLCGARYIELKTIQHLDILEIAKPCIDMQDEGYNCEWSQELELNESFDQYLNAMIMIHILNHRLKLHEGSETGMLFNMSVGYDLAGIMKPNVQRFLDQMKNSSEFLEEKINAVKDIYPEVTQLNINPRLSDNVTLSTMHGCPPDEIEKIARYLIEERRLHTTIKLNPTLLGEKEVREILHRTGFKTIIPEDAFGHDLKYEDATRIIKNLQESARRTGVKFGLKLTNTLESVNHKSLFPKEAERMYMSGRALHPLAVNLAAKLQREFDGALDVSFSGGANCFNIHELIAAGLAPVTVCSDLLKPGGYALLPQHMENLKSHFGSLSCDSIENYIKARAGGESDVRQAALKNLKRYADEVMEREEYKKTGFSVPDVKSSRPLKFFDCIAAPCVETCPSNQEIPDYMHFTAKGNPQRALDVIMATNPFPHTTGMVCDHPCQLKCTRMNYEDSLLIREIKRYAAENAKFPELSVSAKGYGRKASVIGAGPSGLTCAYYLAKAGFEVNVYESKPGPGGMVTEAIPAFRLSENAVNADLDFIMQAGATIHFDQHIDRKKFAAIRGKSDFVYIATGAPISRKLLIKNIETPGVMDPLDFLSGIKAGNLETGKSVLIVGGGNTAMDIARTVARLTGKEGKVTIVYRRGLEHMPAEEEEIRAAMTEGVHFIEKASPVEVKTENGRLKSLFCQKVNLVTTEKGGRPVPEPIPGSEFEIQADTLIPAIGQDFDTDLIDRKLLETGKYRQDNIFIGGDARLGASTVINAIADGKNAAFEIMKKAGFRVSSSEMEKDGPFRQPESYEELMLRRYRKVRKARLKEKSPEERMSFEPVILPMSREEAEFEAARCLKCDELCNICMTVCPNLANVSYQVKPVELKLKKLVRTGDKIWAADDRTFKVDQGRQILHIADWCNKCGNCATFCPTAGAPYLDKPHLYLDKDELEEEKDGFYLEQAAHGPKLIRFIGAEKHELADNGKFIYKTSGVEVILDKESFDILEHHMEPGLDTVKLEIAAEMAVIMEGAKEFLNHH